MVYQRLKGQALTEMALVLPVFLLVILSVIDLFPLLADVLVLKAVSARGARAAAISLPPDDCPALVAQAMGTPALLFADWSYIPPCASGQTFASGVPVTLAATLEYHPSFWGGTWTLPVSTTDFGR